MVKDQFQGLCKHFCIHLGYSFDDIILVRFSPFCGGIPLPCSGVVGKNLSAQNILVHKLHEGGPVFECRLKTRQLDHLNVSIQMVCLVNKTST